jgi:hypothetical protein
MVYLDIFQAFDERDLDYVVIGGVALVMHGVVRLTADLDLMVALDAENLRKLVEIMARLGYRPRVPEPAEALLDPRKRQEWREQKHMEVFSFYAPQQPLALIDIMIHEPLDYRTLRANAVRMNLHQLAVPVASIDDLIALKSQAGRPQDLEDIRALKELRRG